MNIEIVLRGCVISPLSIGAGVRVRAERGGGVGRRGEAGRARPRRQRRPDEQRVHQEEPGGQRSPKYYRFLIM